MNLITELIVKFRDILKQNEKAPKRTPRKNDQSHVMSEEEKLDQTLEDSFPASDPPGHFAKSEEDLKHY